MLPESRKLELRKYRVPAEITRTHVEVQPFFTAAAAEQSVTHLLADTVVLALEADDEALLELD